MTAQTLWLVALTGLLGAPHCIGMCGGTMTSLTLQARGSALAVILAYNCGRILTYTCIGAFMGGAGSFVDGAAQLTGLQGFASLLGGVLILLWTYRKLAIPLAEWGPLRLASAQRLLTRLRASQSSGAVFATGVLLGFLPCGLTYAMEINECRDKRKRVAGRPHYARLRPRDAAGTGYHRPARRLDQKIAAHAHPDTRSMGSYIDRNTRDYARLSRQRMDPFDPSLAVVSG